MASETYPTATSATEALALLKVRAAALRLELAQSPRDSRQPIQDRLDATVDELETWGTKLDQAEAEDHDEVRDVVRNITRRRNKFGSKIGDVTPAHDAPTNRSRGR
jgi:hypothetical protein